MPKKKIRLIVEKFGYHALRKYCQIDDEHFSVVADCKTKLVINIRTRECFRWNPHTKKLVKL
ncbi:MULTISPECIES: hypothetical protein [Enterococcus]|uniref:hypothetical protein n=1 Tax=Enterococcus TaxID=1350 RepID=UPI0022E67D3F|nr:MULTISPECIES: hypothetical protein [Enterococcus]